TAGPLAADRNPVRRAPVRRVQDRRLHHAGLAGRADRDRARRPVAHRAVHRRSSAGAGDVRRAGARPSVPATAPRREEGGAGMSAQTLEARPRTIAVVSWKTPIILAVVTVLVALLPLLVPRSGDATFRFAAGSDAIHVPDIVVPGTATALLCVLIGAIIAVVSFVLAARHRTTPLWLIALYAIALIFGFLAWAAAGSSGTLPMISLLSGALALATPLIFGALGGVIGERAGVVNIAIEAQLLAGAFSAAIVASLTGTPWAGLVAAMVAGVLVALVLAVFAITYYVDQV